MHYEEMANFIIKLCHDEKLRNEMGKNGYNRVAQHYERTAFIEGYKQVYKALGGTF